MATRTTAIYPYKDLVVSAAAGETDLAAATGFLAANALPADILLGAKSLKDNYSGGRHSYFNAVILRCYATCSNDDQASMTLYGISRMAGTIETFIPERIAAITWTFGNALRVGGVSWAQTTSVTDYHIGDIREADNAGNDTIARIELDALGYEWLYAIVHTRDTGTPTAITVEMRPY